MLTGADVQQETAMRGQVCAEFTGFVESFNICDHNVVRSWRGWITAPQSNSGLENEPFSLNVCKAGLPGRVLVHAPVGKGLDETPD